MATTLASAAVLALTSLEKPIHRGVGALGSLDTGWATVRVVLEHDETAVAHDPARRVQLHLGV